MQLLSWVSRASDDTHLCLYVNTAFESDSFELTPEIDTFQAFGAAVGATMVAGLSNSRKTKTHVSQQSAGSTGDPLQRPSYGLFVPGTINH